MKRRTSPRSRRLVLRALCLLLLATGAAPVSAQTTEMGPGDSLGSVLADVEPGATVLVKRGDYSRQLIKNRHFSPPVVIVGEDHQAARIAGLDIKGSSGIVVRGLTIHGSPSKETRSTVMVYGGSSDIRLEQLSLAPTAVSGVAIFEKSHDVVIDEVSIDGSRARGRDSRGVWIGSEGSDSSGWVRDVTVRRSDIVGAAADGIHVGGGVDVLIEANRIWGLQENDDHNDAVQVVGSRRLRVVGNTLGSPTHRSGDQGLILGHQPVAGGMRVVDSLVANNLILNWTESPLLLAGADGVELLHNTVVGSGRPTYLVPGVVETNRRIQVWNNVFDHLRVTAPVEGRGRNCVRDGDRAPSDVEGDPQFVSTETYALSPTSPCVGIGDPAQSLPRDRAGIARDAQPDAGALELSAAGGVGEASGRSDSGAADPLSGTPPSPATGSGRPRTPDPRVSPVASLLALALLVVVSLTAGRLSRPVRVTASHFGELSDDSRTT